MTCLPVILSQDEYISHYAMHKGDDSDFYKSYSLIRYSKRAVYSVHTFSPFLSSRILHLYSKYLSNSTYHFTRSQTKVLSTSQLMMMMPTANPVSYNHHNPRLVHIHLQDYRPCHYGYCMSGRCVESRSKRILRFWTPVYYSRQKNFGKYYCQDVLLLLLFPWVPSGT
ncbi:unnamed protein product [Trichobilharzia regenti]|nr:unnamed protein product [Trichobilharzia regenti]